MLYTQRKRSEELMAKKKEFGEGIVYTITNYIWWFVLANIYFGLVNIPFILVYLGSTAGGKFEFSFLFVLSLLPAGPAITALLSVMGKLVRDKDVNVTKDFFKAYKTNFMESLFYWAAFIIVLGVLYIDILYFNSKPQIIFIKYIFIGIGIIAVSTSFYIFAVISRFYLRAIDVLKIALYYSIKKLHLTIFNWAYLFGLSVLLTRISGAVFILAGWSILAYLLMFNMKGVLSEIEEKFVKSET
jgi:uncharacterized membrane protein YesL